MSAHVVCLVKGGSGECRLTGEALQAISFCCAVIAVAVGAWVELGRSGGMAGWCGRTDVLGVGWLFECVLAAVCVVQCPPGGAVLEWRWLFEAGGGASPIAEHLFALAHLNVGVSRGSSGIVGDIASTSMRRSFQVLLA